MIRESGLPSGLEIEGRPLLFAPNIDTRYGLAKSRRCRARELRNRVTVPELDDGTNLILTRIPIDNNFQRNESHEMPIPIENRVRRSCPPISRDGTRQSRSRRSDSVLGAWTATG
jgi:hypothetical protein